MNIKYALISYLIAILVFISIWIPEIKYYYVNTPIITHETILQSKETPSNSIIDELSMMSLGPELNFSNKVLIDTANKIVGGQLQLPGYDTIPIHLPFDSQDLSKGLPTWKLYFASLVAPDILLNAYALTGNEDYYKLAKDMIMAWARYEMAQWLPNGFLWNDHAIAARVIVLTKFWSIYRENADFSSDEASIVLELVYHSGELLAKDEHFNFATNHGIMQNIALLHIASAFPALPNTEKLKHIALNRLHEQMEYYINTEGVVLEHSAEYHHHGMVFIARILRYLTMNDIVAPSSWINKYDKSKEFTAIIRRPDGTLPIYGNTKGNFLFDSTITSTDTQQGKVSRLYRTNEWNPASTHALYPVAGYSVWWNNLNIETTPHYLSQTILTWSHFLGHGHKLADEMSVLIWADNQTWVTNTGYWPYGVPGRGNVNSWEGSNAPHILAEPWNSNRHAELLFYAVENEVAINHLRRAGPDGYSAERQVIYIKPGLWLILDNVSDQTPRKTTTTWTFSHDLKLSKGSKIGQYHLSQPDRSACMTAFLLGSKDTSITSHKGSMEPFAGWVVIGNKPMQAPSLVTEQSSDNVWQATILSLEKNCKERFDNQAVVVDWQDSNHWKITLPLISGNVDIERTNRSISMDRKPSDSEKITLFIDTAIDTSIEKQLIYDAFQASAQKSKRYNQDIFNYRIKISYLLIGILFIQELFFLLCSRFASTRGYLVNLRILSYLSWIAISLYLFLIYFRS